MFESPYARRLLVEFFRARLPRAGWRFDSAFAAAAGIRGRTCLRFTRGRSTVLVSLFPAAGEGSATDFRLSVTRRR